MKKILEIINTPMNNNTSIIFNSRDKIFYILIVYCKISNTAKMELVELNELPSVTVMKNKTNTML